MEYRCEGRVHAKIADGKLEVKCRSNRCGARSGVVVLHYFDLATGVLIETKKFTDPAKFIEGEQGDDLIPTASLRPSRREAVCALRGDAGIGG